MLPPPSPTLFPYTTLFRSPALMSRLREHLHQDALTVTGKTVGENIEPAEVYNDDVIRPLDRPIYEEGADRKSTRLNSSHVAISYAVFCLKKKKKEKTKMNE